MAFNIESTFRTNFEIISRTVYTSTSVHYGNAGCGVFKWVYTCIKLERFLPKNQRTQRKLLNFENWINREV